MISVTKIIRQIAGPVLAPYGFSYIGKLDAGCWRFARNKGGVDQFVDFVKSFHEDRALRVDLSTSVEPAAMPASALVTSGKPSAGWWTYKDDASLEAVVKDLVAITIEHGLPCLEVLSRPKATVPTDVAQRLLSEHDTLAERMREKLGVSYDDLSALPRLERFVHSIEWDLACPDWEQLSSAAAFLGEVLITNLGGEWSWDDTLSTAAVSRIGGRPGMRIQVLMWVATYWSRRDERNGFEGGYQGYKSILEIK